MVNFLKRIVKRSLQVTLAAVGPQCLHWGKNQLMVMMYHRVLPEDHPDRQHEQPGMYVSPETFEMHMQELQARFEFVRLDDWIQKVSSGETVPKMACAVTFDDGWRDNFEFAFPVLERYQIPATIFVVSEFVGMHYSFWPNRLARLLAGLSAEELNALSSTDDAGWLFGLELSFNLSAQQNLGQAQIDEIIEASKQFAEPELHRRLDQLDALLNKAQEKRAPDMLDWQQIHAMVDSGLVTIGSHTRRHTRLLESLDDNALKDELEGSKQDIAMQLQRDVKLFCYPNGDFTAAAVDVVARNYLGACTTRSGWNTASGNRWKLNRIGVHEDISSDRTAFLARLSGWI